MTYTVIPKDTLLKVNGKTYRCHCGCNVFRPVKDDDRPNRKIYQCNGCGDWYMEGDVKGEEELKNES